MTDARAINRRRFLQTGLAGSAVAVIPGLRAQGVLASAPATNVAIVADPADGIAAAPAARWAAGELRRALLARHATVRLVDAIGQSRADETLVIAAGSGSAAARRAAAAARVSVGAGPECLALLPALSGRRAVLATGSDARGLVYALLDLADRVATTPSVSAALSLSTPVVQAPTNLVRSVMRQFTSEELDRGWFNDREMWPAYLSMLAANRFNRLHLAFGLGYDMLQQVTDSYLLFLYPFLIDVPGYRVHLTNLPDAERASNLAMLRYISDETAARGLAFELGIWMHGYQLLNSPRAKYLVEGLTPDTHAAYCRDALTAVLRACPSISAVGLRIHGESGVAEGSYDFWQTVFEGVSRAGRTIEIDLHAKGVDQTMIDRALGTGMPVNVSPKYWAEHLGMPYHQAAIRDLEMPVTGQIGRGLMTFSEGARSFTRYGYADLLRDDRRYTVRHRVFAGTQRLLMSGDTATTAAYSRMFQFCGSTGVDLMEPLTCRGRRGSGIAGARRTGYADAALEPRWDWEKYDYWYRVWGRLTYDAAARPDDCRRALPRSAAGDALAAALASASRILPIVTTAHLPSAACDAYWPEIYWNQPMVDEPRPNPYGDTPAPKTFVHVSPLDPQLFSSVDAHAGDLLLGTSTGQYSPIEVAQWLEDLAADAKRHLRVADGLSTPDARRMAIDAHLQAALGEFFAAKLRAGVLWAIHARTGDGGARAAALAGYRRAREAWAGVADRARPIYAADLSVSDRFDERGHWADRLAAIDEDIARLEGHAAPAASGDPARARAALASATGRPVRPPAPCAHTPPAAFAPNTDLVLELRLAAGAAARAVWCEYRHVNQAERFVRTGLAARDGAYRATIPAAYTDSPYALQYYFVVETTSATHLYPGLGEDRLQMPYVVVEREGRRT